MNPFHTAQQIFRKSCQVLVNYDEIWFRNMLSNALSELVLTFSVNIHRAAVFIKYHTLCTNFDRKVTVPTRYRVY
jgi:hypothetical protein